MKRWSLCLVGTVLLTATCIALPVAAEEAEEKERELPSSGMLAGTVSGPGSNELAGPWGTEESTDAGGAPLAGSMSRLSPSQWQARVFNNSKDPYSVDVEILQLDERGAKIKSDSFSATIRPKSSVERTVSAASGARNGAVNLRSWKNLAPKKKAPVSSEDGDAGDTASAAPAEANTPIPPDEPDMN